MSGEIVPYEIAEQDFDRAQAFWGGTTADDEELVPPLAGRRGSRAIEL